MSADRLLTAFRKLVREAFPRLDYLGLWEYRVVAGSGVTGWALRSMTSGMPDLAGVPGMYPIASSTTRAILPGSVVLVGFVNGDPARPFIAHEPSGIGVGDTVEITPGTPGQVVVGVITRVP